LRLVGAGQLPRLEASGKLDRVSIAELARCCLCDTDDTHTSADFVSHSDPFAREAQVLALLQRLLAPLSASVSPFARVDSLGLSSLDAVRVSAALAALGIRCPAHLLFGACTVEAAAACLARGDLPGLSLLVF
jgi:hypothetical protein